MGGGRVLDCLLTEKDRKIKVVTIYKLVAIDDYFIGSCLVFIVTFICGNAIYDLRWFYLPPKT